LPPGPTAASRANRPWHGPAFHDHGSWGGASVHAAPSSSDLAGRTGRASHAAPNLNVLALTMVSAGWSPFLVPGSHACTAMGVPCAAGPRAGPGGGKERGAGETSGEPRGCGEGFRPWPPCTSSAIPWSRTLARSVNRDAFSRVEFHASQRRAAVICRAA
jgi:hypothetical protein